MVFIILLTANILLTEDVSNCKHGVSFHCNVKVPSGRATDSKMIVQVGSICN